MKVDNIITADHVRLRPLTEQDMTLKVKWYNDPLVRKTLVIDEQFELDKTIEWFQSLAGRNDRADFAVESLDGVPIGITGLIDIDRRNKTAQCYCVIGEKTFWGQGLGTEIHSVLFQWAFEKLDIQKIWAHIRTNNPAIFRVVEKLGFQIEGTLRRHAVVNSQRIDLYQIGLLREEFIPTHQHYEMLDRPQ
ncbi:MAG TPA: GNAT family protein [Anaerohalosphaeraceae bacterium]|nr:GNAT family N-acetyltransferase [Phycisphaerae bacterium]HOK96044.1 GNAT family protein [Anaerohalosphaeraceae bacterium]HOL31033.1 GNAT family protein [Anaerohalosphaeraceae bacterium]HOM76689.1 GNAT family protein [Anaerohalosphaeraceae bacterium]HPC64126.1 GNAT family protein [Anaerohalosphaeraceae bacterium]